jgi:thiosulfate/3-mercaptopyruvate sulfurtransferase
MKRTTWILLLLAVIIAWPLAALAKDIPPVVSTAWLEQNLQNPRLVVVDIRKLEEYKEAQIPGSVNVFYGVWAIKKGDLDNELPETDDLFDIIGSAGIKNDSLVVVAGKTETVTDLVNMTRVAWTLIYAGIENVAVLDGGFTKWASDKKPVSTAGTKPKAVEYKGKVNPSVLASKADVLGVIGKAMIVDTRMPDFYFGVTKLPFVGKFGHIPGAGDLPSAWIFSEGTFKAKEELEAMAAGVVGADKAKEVVVYCDTGRLASGWWWVLHEVLGYQNVKSYDGSMQEWGKDANTPVMKYRWQ